jgi:hypothetical protein
MASIVETGFSALAILILSSFHCLVHRLDPGLCGDYKVLRHYIMHWRILPGRELALMVLASEEENPWGPQKMLDLAEK